MDESINSVGDAMIFSTLDTFSDFWKIKIADADRHKTAFTLHHGLFRFARMGIWATEFACVVSRLHGCCIVSWKVAISYDIRWWRFHILVDPGTTHRPGQSFLGVLKQAGSTQNMKKCKLFAGKKGNLGQVISPDRLQIALHTTDLTKDTQNQMNVTK